MGIFDRFFAPRGERPAAPDVTFGRYSDAYKADAQYQHWDEALRCYDAGEHLAAYRHFFAYLRDEALGNVEWQERPDGGLSFALYQGSRRVSGWADAERLRAEARIAQVRQPQPALLRSLLERNFDLSYGRFGMDEAGFICIVFDSYTLDGSPYKLYAALKEIATQADKQDDLLLDAFEGLLPVDNARIRPVPEAQQRAKYAYVQRSIAAALHWLDHGPLDAAQYAGGAAYILLELAYRLDYLIKPEGYMMEALERIHRQYFESDALGTAEKNARLRRELEALCQRPPADFYKEFYDVTATFGITAPVSQDRLAQFISTELRHMDWYYDNGYHAVALAVPGYIVGYALFNWAVPRPLRALLHLYYEVVEAGFFRELGFPEVFYVPDEPRFDRAAIRREVQRIVRDNRRKFPGLSADLALLDFRDLPSFARSFLLMLAGMEVLER